MSLLQERERGRKKKEWEMGSIFTVENREHTETKERAERLLRIQFQKCPTAENTDFIQAHENRN